MNIQEQVVNETLARIQKTDPTMYSLILRNYKPKLQMAGLGALLDDFSGAFNKALDLAATVYTTNNAANIAQDNAKLQAQEAAQKAQAQLDALRIQSANQYTAMQGQQQSLQLQQYLAQLQSGDKNKMLLAAAAGLGVLLVVMVISRKSKGR